MDGGERVGELALHVLGRAELVRRALAVVGRAPPWRRGGGGGGGGGGAGTNVQSLQLFRHLPIYLQPTCHVDASAPVGKPPPWWQADGHQVGRELKVPLILHQGNVVL